MEYVIDKKRLILELAIVVVLVGVLLILSVSVIKNTKNNEQESKPEILVLNNFYINYIEPPEINLVVYPTPMPGYPKVHETYYERHNENYRYHEESIYLERRKPVEYESYSYFSQQIQKNDFLGGYVNEYRVYVLNKEKTGEYFTVVFNIKYQDGFGVSESITQYLKADEKKVFLYKEIVAEKKEIVSWDYSVKKE